MRILTAQLLFLVHWGILAQTSAGQTGAVHSTIITWSVGELAVTRISNDSLSASQGVIQYYQVPLADQKTLADEHPPHTLERTGKEEDPNGLVSKIYPNPTEGILQITVSKWVGPDVELTINDLLGKTWLHKRVRTVDQQLELDISWLASGIYLLIVNDGQHQAKREIIKTD
ncbi:MAG: T9SS type A sorting domain-containing protein [Bacteroidota bacterium]